MNEKQITEGLRKHWNWLKKKEDYNEVAEFIIAHGKRRMTSDYPITIDNPYGRSAKIHRDGSIVLYDNNRKTEIEFGDTKILEEALAISKEEAKSKD